MTASSLCVVSSFFSTTCPAWQGQEDDDACSEWFDGTMSEILGQQWQRVCWAHGFGRQQLQGHAT